MGEFSLGEDGGVLASPAVWGVLAGYVESKRASETLLHGGYSSILRDFIATATEAAKAPAATVVPLAEPATTRARMLVSVNEAASVMGCSSEYVRRLARKGRLRTQRVGRAWAVELPEPLEGK